MLDHIKLYTSPGLEPVKTGPISNIDKSLKPLSKFLFKYMIKFENIEFLEHLIQNLLDLFLSLYLIP